MDYQQTDGLGKTQLQLAERNMAEANTSKLDDFVPYSIQTIDIGFAVVYGLCMVVGVMGNSLVITVVRKNRSMRTTTDFLFVNLAAADIVTLLFCPRTYAFVFYPIHPTGIAGDLLCKFFSGNAVVSTAIVCSILTLTVLAIERYHALVKPMRSGLRLRKRNVGKVIAALWVMAIGISVPDYIANHYSEHYNRCVCPFSLESMANTRLRVHVICTVGFLGGVPFIVLSFCYFQIIKGLFIDNTIYRQDSSANDRRAKKIRLVKLLISVTLVFYICYIPYARTYASLEKFQTLVDKQDTLSVLLRTFELLVTCSSCLNPVLYAFQSSNYRAGFKHILQARTSSRQENCPRYAQNLLL